MFISHNLNKLQMHSSDKHANFKGVQFEIIKNHPSLFSNKIQFHFPLYVAIDFSCEIKII